MKKSQEKLGGLEGGSTLSFDVKTATLLLDVRLSREISSWLKAHALKEGPFEKKEFHLTLVGSATGKALLTMVDRLSKEKQKQMLEKVKKLAARFGWSFFPKEEYYAISKEYSGEGADDDTEKRTAYIQIVGLPDLVGFYNDLNLFFNTDFEVPFPHLTLFTSSTLKKNELRGIGIYFEDQFKSLNPRSIAPERGEV